MLAREGVKLARFVQDWDALTTSFFAVGETGEVDTNDLEELKVLSSQSGGASRYNLHNDPSDDLHSMVILQRAGMYTQPRKHLTRSKTYSILTGAMVVVVFDDIGKVLAYHHLNSKRVRAVRLAPGVFHTNFTLTDVAIYHEAIRGPYVNGSSDRIYAGFAPDADEGTAAHSYLADELMSRFNANPSFNAPPTSTLPFDADLGSSYIPHFREDSEALTASFFSVNKVSCFSGVEVSALKRLSKLSGRASRCNLHNSTSDDLHSMVILLPEGVYAQPKKHQFRSKIYEIVDGEMVVIVFSDSGDIQSVHHLAEDRARVVRIAPGLFHTNLSISSQAVYHESISGPYDRSARDRTYASFAPNADRQAEGMAYLSVFIH
jgi:cupin fold WbuC family metalloprotein